MGWVCGLYVVWCRRRWRCLVWLVMRAVTRLGMVDDSVAGWIAETGNVGGGPVLHTDRTVTLLPRTAAFLSRSTFLLLPPLCLSISRFGPDLALVCAG